MRIPAPPLWLLGLLALAQLPPLATSFKPALTAEVRSEVSFEEILSTYRPRREIPSAIEIQGQVQGESYSSGQCSVAMAVNYLTGKELRDCDINATYGFALLEALKTECQFAGYDWRDAGDLQPSSWKLIESKLLQERTPVILALNGPEYSPNGRGEIVLLTDIQGETVHYIHPVDGRQHTTTRAEIEASPPFPDGKFIFVAEAL